MTDNKDKNGNSAKKTMAGKSGRDKTASSEKGDNSSAAGREKDVGRDPGQTAGLKSGWKTFLARVEIEKELRFKISVLSLVIIFLGGSIMADANPLRLLIPGATYPFPTLDHRQDIAIYAIERESGKLIQVEKPVLMDGSPVDRVFRLASVVARPGSGLIQNFEFIYAVPYPPFHLSIQKVWMEKGRLVLSIDANSLRRELQERFKGEKLESMEEPAALLDGYFRCLTLTLAESELDGDPIDLISYSLNNEEALEDYKPFMKFSFDARYSTK